VSTFLLLVLGIACTIWYTRQPTAKDKINIVPRSPGFKPLPMQRAAIDEILRREHDRIDAYQTQCYREHLASCARKSQHHFSVDRG
jgi:hypothetical protein